MTGASAGLLVYENRRCVLVALSRDMGFGPETTLLIGVAAWEESASSHSLLSVGSIERQLAQAPPGLRGICRAVFMEAGSSPWRPSPSDGRQKECSS